MIRMSIRAVAALTLVAAAATALAQGAAPVVLRYATQSPEKSLYGAQIARLAQAVAEETGGTVRFDVHWGGTLGREADMPAQIARGRVDASGVSIVMTAQLVPELQLLLLPMYFSSPAEMDCVIDRHLADTVAQRLEARGVRVLRWGEAGTIEMIGKKSFANVADLAGAKAGTYGSRMGVLMWQALGAHPTPTSAGELASGFQTGLLDVATTVPTYYVALGFNKVAPVMTRLDLFFASSVNLISQAAWDRLSPEQRAGVMRASQRIPVSQTRAEVREAQQRQLDAHVAGGGQLAIATAAQREAYRKVVSKAWPQMAQEAGPEGPVFFALMEAARKACGGSS